MRQEKVFILRLWSDQTQTKPSDASWRASLENMLDKESKSFASLEQLFSYLQTEQKET